MTDQLNPIAWLHENREDSISDTRKRDNLKDGGASASSMKSFSIPLYTIEECSHDVYESGKSIGLFDMRKEVAEHLCHALSSVFNTKVDWHYFGGRVHIKALISKEVSND